MFIEGKVTKELLDQAVAYAALNDAQQIYANTQKEMASLTERKAVNTAFVAGKLTTTADWGIGIQDDQDPTKIVAITELKNQQYALDLLNKQSILQQELVIKQDMFDKEAKAYEVLANKKLEIEQQYTKDYLVEINTQKQALQSLLDMQARSAARASSSLAGSSNITTTTNNLWGVTVNAAASTNVNAIAKQVQASVTAKLK